VKRTLIALVMAAGLTAAGAIAQTAPVGGPDAKGNSPIKHAHTINDGAAKPAANSFTQGQAMRHIEHSGYSGVTGLTKGEDGIWRATAMKGGAPVNVALDFKGNVTEGMAPGASGSGMPVSSATEPGMPTTSQNHHHHWRHHWRRHHHASGGGVAMSGLDRNKNGVSDKEDRARR